MRKPFLNLAVQPFQVAPGRWNVGSKLCNRHRPTQMAGGWPAGRCGTARLSGPLIALDGPRLDDPAAIVRAMAVWALAQLLD